MNIEQVRLLCLSKAHTTEDMPFDDTFVTFKVAGKIFAGLPLEHPGLLVLKCNSEYFDDLCAAYPSIHQAWHWHKKHWVQLQLDGSDISDALVRRLIDDAYIQVIAKFSRKLRVELDLEELFQLSKNSFPPIE